MSNVTLSEYKLQTDSLKWSFAAQLLYVCQFGSLPLCMSHFTCTVYAMSRRKCRTLQMFKT